MTYRRKLPFLLTDHPAHRIADDLRGAYDNGW